MKLSVVVGKLVLHASSAMKSLEAQEGSHCQPDGEQEVFYHPDDARSIILASYRTIKSMMDTVQTQDSRNILSFIVQEHPGVTEIMSRCSKLVEGERDLARLAMVLGAETARQKETLARLRAAVVLQATWRAVLTRRKYKVMLKGFKALQKLYRELIHRRKLFDRELSMEKRFKESEVAFDKKFQALIEKRVSTEEKLRVMEAKPPKDLVDYIQALEREEERDAERREADILHDMVAAEEEEKLNSAALKIQAAIRRWLIRKRDRRPAVWSRNLLRTTMTEAKARSYQDKIELWQQRNNMAPMTPGELQELHHKAQSQFSKFSARLNKNRLEDHKTLAMLAQTETALAVMECAPSLREYTTSQWSQFHSLPLHVAVKGRMEHNAAMRRMEQDRWRRILDEYG